MIVCMLAGAANFRGREAIENNHQPFADRDDVMFCSSSLHVIVCPISQAVPVPLTVVRVEAVTDN